MSNRKLNEMALRGLLEQKEKRKRVGGYVATNLKFVGHSPETVILGRGLSLMERVTDA